MFYVLYMQAYNLTGYLSIMSIFFFLALGYHIKVINI